MPTVDATSAIDLPSYGDALVSSCESFVETAVRGVDVDDSKTAAGPGTNAHVDAMTTRACVDACARLDAEATKGTARWMVRSFLATTRTVTDDGRIHSIHAVGVFFRDDADADVVDDERARGMLAALCDAHAALTIDVSRTLAMNGGAGGRYYREEVVERARTCARATTALVRACCARDGDGRGKNVRVGVGRVWEASKSFVDAPKDAVRAISHRLMRSARFVVDVRNELKTLGAETEADAAPTGSDADDDLLFCDDDFDEDEIRRAKAMSAYATACALVLKTFIAPTVRERRARVDALEPMVEACEGFRRAVEDVGAGAYPPHDADALKKDIEASVRAAEEMRACVREAGVPDEDVEPGFAEFVDAAETAKRAAVE